MLQFAIKVVKRGNSFLRLESLLSIRAILLSLICQLAESWINLGRTLVHLYLISYLLCLKNLIGHLTVLRTLHAHVRWLHMILVVIWLARGGRSEVCRTVTLMCICCNLGAIFARCLRIAFLHDTPATRLNLNRRFIQILLACLELGQLLETSLVKLVDCVARHKLNNFLFALLWRQTAYMLNLGHIIDRSKLLLH